MSWVDDAVGYFQDTVGDVADQSQDAIVSAGVDYVKQQTNAGTAKPAAVVKTEAVYSFKNSLDANTILTVVGVVGLIWFIKKNKKAA